MHYSFCFWGCMPKSAAFFAHPAKEVNAMEHSSLFSFLLNPPLLFARSFGSALKLRGHGTRSAEDYVYKLTPRNRVWHGGTDPVASTAARASVRGWTSRGLFSSASHTKTFRRARKPRAMGVKASSVSWCVGNLTSRL